MLIVMCTEQKIFEQVIAASRSRNPYTWMVVDQGRVDRVFRVTLLVEKPGTRELNAT
jgi:hypothetical protein